MWDETDLLQGVFRIKTDDNLLKIVIITFVNYKNDANDLLVKRIFSNNEVVRRRCELTEESPAGAKVLRDRKAV